MKKIIFLFINLVNKILARKNWIICKISQTSDKKLTFSNRSQNLSIYGEYVPRIGVLYQENSEIGSKNLSEKFERIKKGQCFEWPNMVALNHAIAVFIGDAKKIINIGAGTGTFEWFASVDSSIQFVASEFDVDCVNWCKANRQRDNIIYCSKSIEQLIGEYEKFDLAIAVDVIEHIKDFSSFLKDFSMLADRAVITTPNKDREYTTAISSSPEYYQHVREWDAGEFFWILKMFYNEVQLFAMPNLFVPQVEKIGLLSVMTPLIAVCKK